MKTFLLPAALLFALSGCASLHVQAPPVSGPIEPPSGGIAGYQHGTDRSRFMVGDNPYDVAELGYIKRVGSEGTLAVLASNGSVTGIPNAQSRALQLPPFGMTPQDHDRFVRDYFERSGIPAAQIRAIRTATLLEASGSSDDVSTARPKVTAYYSVIERAVEGVPVPDSFAWARVNRDGQVVAEAVYWPALPAGVLAQAQRMSQGSALPRVEQAIKARPAETQVDHQVTIRHSSAAYDGSFAAHASIDVRVRLEAAARADADSRQAAGSGGVGAGLIRHFNDEGAEFQLPQEIPSVGRPARTKQRATSAAVQ